MFKTIVEKANMSFDETSDDKEFFVNQEDYKAEKYERNMRLKLIQKVNAEKLNLESIQANGLNGRIQGTKRVNEQLNEYINNVFKEHEDEKEFVLTNKILLSSSNTLDTMHDTNDVISIPASQTIDLIYKYRVHAHPNNYIRYPYKSVNYYTFREKDGWMKKLYALENTISFNPQNTKKLYKSTLDLKIKQRILSYIDGRNKSMGFEDEEYKFYILSDSITLPKPVSLPKRNNHKYYSISQLYNESEMQIEFIESYSYIQKSGKKIFNKNSMENSIFKDIFNKIFDYDKFSSNGINTYIEGDFNKKKWGAYDLCEELNVNVCPYCNRSYTFTVRKIIDNNINPKREAINIIRPQLDHYFPQSKYPIFALSFYNLIPSCSICNSSIKGNKDLNLLDNLHPYLDSIDDYYTFDYNILSGSVFDGDKDGVEIIISKKMGYTDIKSENNINFFKIKEIYKQHNDVVSNLVYKRRKYTDSRLEEIEELFNLNRGSIISKEELFKDVFNELNEDEIIDTSLGKLNRDIVDKLKRIKN